MKRIVRVDACMITAAGEASKPDAREDHKIELRGYSIATVVLGMSMSPMTYCEERVPSTT